MGGSGWRGRAILHSAESLRTVGASYRPVGTVCASGPGAARLGGRSRGSGGCSRGFQGHIEGEKFRMKGAKSKLMCPGSRK